MDNKQMQKVIEIQARYEGVLMQKRHVVGVAVGTGTTQGVKKQETLQLVVMVDKAVPNEMLPPEDHIPTEIEGVPVAIQEVGTPQAQAPAAFSAPVVPPVVAPPTAPTQPASLENPPEEDSSGEHDPFADDAVG